MRAAAITMLTSVCLSYGYAFADDTRIECTVSSPGARYRLFSTKNVWTVLQLDMQTGQLWQVQSGESGTRTKLVIKAVALADRHKPGRFTLCPTGNMWTFVLLDQESGRTWQAQFSVNDNNHGIAEIRMPAPDGFIPDLQSK